MKRRLSVVRAPGGSSGRGAGSQPAGGASAPLAGFPLPANVAFRDVVWFVAGELWAAGEQWDDRAKQAAVSAMLEIAFDAGWLKPWERAA